MLCQGYSASSPEGGADPGRVRPPQCFEEEPGADEEEAGGRDVTVVGSLLRVGLVGFPAGLDYLDVDVDAAVPGWVEAEAHVVEPCEGVVVKPLGCEGLDGDFVEASLSVVDEPEEGDCDVARGPEGEGDVVGVGLAPRAVAVLDGSRVSYSE